MTRGAVLALFLASFAAVPARAAGDPAAVAAVEPFLRDDEKAMLAAVLADKAAAEEFNADVKLAAGDAKVMKLVLTKWRGRIVAFAEADARIPTPDLEGTYKNSSAMMRPQTRAYLLRRLKTMSEGDRNSLIEYLASVDSALADNGGKLTWYTKKVVAGIFDKYREDLSLYLPVPLAQDAKRGAPAAAAALADLRKAAETPVVAEPAPADPVAVKKPAAKDPVAKNPASGKKPSSAASDRKTGVVVSTSTAALEQAKDAARAEERAGEKFDGSSGTAGVGAVAGSAGKGLPPLAGAPPSAGKPSLTEVPSPADADESFMADLKKMKTGKAPAKFHEFVPGILGGLAGGLLGGLLGFLLGGPVGLAIGAVAGAGGGAVAGHLIGRKLFK